MGAKTVNMYGHQIHIGSPSHLSLKNNQVQIRNKETKDTSSVPVEDISSIILAHPQITLSAAVMAHCVAQGVGIISCDAKYLPIGMMLSLDGHSIQQRIISAQLKASKPLKKQLWQSIIEYKVRNQLRLLETLDLDHAYLKRLSTEVKSGDNTAVEGKAARHYWRQYFCSVNAHHGIPDATYRKRDGFPPNNWLNYGYAILRSMVSRALTASGLLPVVGIFHHNKYNAYCLADDIMEPFRPIVDQLVYDLCMKHPLSMDIPMDIKSELLQIATLDCVLDQKQYTLHAALDRTTASLAQSFLERTNLITYPLTHV